MIRLDCWEELQYYTADLPAEREAPPALVSLSAEVMKAREQPCNYLVVSQRPEQCLGDCLGTVNDRSGMTHSVYSLDIYMAQADWLFDETTVIRNNQKKKILDGLPSRL